jgi:hypothetical protein
MTAEIILKLQSEIELMNENQRVIGNNLLLDPNSNFFINDDIIYIIIRNKKHIFSQYVKLKCGCP